MTLKGDVGRLADPMVANHPVDRTSVRQRLWELGYGRDSLALSPPVDSCEAKLDARPSASSGPGFVSVSLQDHLTRVFLCAATGIHAFEDNCDVQRINGNCAVNGVECPIPARTFRQTCLRLALPCAQGIVRPSSTEHKWLRAKGAPGWVSLPHTSHGYAVEQGSTPFAFGTSWLAEALVMAGRDLAQANERPLRVLKASGREGGILPDESEHQTGLQITFLLPVDGDSAVDWNATRRQVAALETAGFESIKLKGSGEYSTCIWKTSLCIDSNALMGEMRARLSPPRLSSQHLLPQVVDATLEPGPQGDNATLTLLGHDLGLSGEDVIEVALGDHICELLPNGLHMLERGMELTAVCLVRGSMGLLRGRPSVTTDSGGRGEASVVLESMLEHRVPSMARPAPAQEQSLDSSWKPPPAVVVPADTTRMGPVRPLEAVSSRNALRELQAVMSGSLPTCTLPIPPDVTAMERPADPQPLPLLVAPSRYPELSRKLTSPWTGLTAPTVVGPLSLAMANCSFNEAHDRFSACAHRLLQPHFPTRPQATWKAQLLLRAFPHLSASSIPAETFKSSSRCPLTSDPPLMLGNLSLPGPMGSVPFGAQLPTGGPFDPLTGLPDGLLVDVGPFTAHSGLGLGANDELRVKLTSIAFGAANELVAACSGEAAVPYRVFLEVWVLSVGVPLHALIEATLSFSHDSLVALPAGDLALLAPPLKIVFVDGTNVSTSDERELSVPPSLRSYSPGMHISGVTELLAGPAHQLACAVAWLTLDAHPCQPQPIRAEISVPPVSTNDYDGVDNALHRSHMTAKLVPETLVLGSTFFASLGETTLRINDLRAVEMNAYNERVTNVASLSIAHLAVRLPSRADCSVGLGGWKEEYLIRDVAAEYKAVYLSTSQMASLAHIYPSNATNIASSLHQFVHLGKLHPTLGFGRMAAEPGHPWSNPLGTYLALDTVHIDVTYSIVHPATSLEGPAIRAGGQVTLASGRPIDITIEMGRGFGSSNAAMSTDTGLYITVPSLATIDGVDILDVFQRLGHLQAAASAVSDPPMALRRIILGDDLVGCLAAAAVWVPPHSWGVNVFPGFSCSPGFHAAATGTAWALPVTLLMDATLAEAAGSGFTFNDVWITALVKSPADMTAGVKAGVRAVVGTGTFVENCIVTWAMASFKPMQLEPNTVIFAINSTCTYGNFSIAMHLELAMSNDLLQPPPASPPEQPSTVDAQAYGFSELISGVKLHWPTRMALRVRADFVSVHAIVALFLSTYPIADQHERHLPLGFHYLHVTNVRGCLAAQEAPGYCLSGAHTIMPINAAGGFFGVGADVYITAATSSLGALGPLHVDVVTRDGELAKLWQPVREGILSAVGPDRWNSMEKFLQRVSLASVRFEYVAAVNSSGALSILLNDHIKCSGEQFRLSVPLTAFESLVWTHQAFTPQMLESVISSLPLEILLESLALTARDPGRVYFNTAADIPAEVNALTKMSNSTLSDIILLADVCRLGVIVEYLEIVPPTKPSSLCDAVWEWKKRAEVIRVGLAANASCGRYFAMWELEQLQHFEARLETLKPAITVDACLQASTFASGVRRAVELPAEALQRNLKDLEAVLQGLEDAWTSMAGSTETTAAKLARERVLLLVPSAVQRVREVVEWDNNAHSVANAVHQVAAVLAFEKEIGAGTATGQLQQWGAMIRSILDGLPSEIPNLASVFSSVKLQAQLVADRAGLVESSVPPAETLIQQAAALLQMLDAAVETLNPEPVRRAEMGKLGEIDFGLIDGLLDTAFAYVADNRNLRTTMSPLRPRVHVDACTSRVDLGSEGCQIRGILEATNLVRELLSQLHSAGLEDFPDLAAGAIASLPDDMKATSEMLAECMAALADMKSRLPDYLDAIDAVAGGQAERVHQVSDIFFAHLDAMDSSAAEVLRAIDNLRGSSDVIGVLRTAATRLSVEKHSALLKATTKLQFVFSNLGDRLFSTPFKQLLSVISTSLTPVTNTIADLENFLLRKRYVDHLLALPAEFLKELLSFNNSLVTMGRPASLVPHSGAIAEEVDKLFSTLPIIQSDLLDVLLANSTCLNTPLCQASLLVKVHKARLATHALHHKLRLLPGMTDRLKEPLLALVDIMDVNYKLAPDLELMDIWATSTLDGVTPAATPGSWTAQQPPILRQLSGALCNELARRAEQGRDSAPLFELELPCSELEVMYEFATNTTELGVTQSAESWDLWHKLVSSITSFKSDLSGQHELMVSEFLEVAAARSRYRELSTNFTSAFSAMAPAYSKAFEYQVSMQPVFNLEDGILLTQHDTEASMTIQEISNLQISTLATLQRTAAASGDPWTCAEAPKICAHVVALAPQVEASHVELLFSGALMVPTTLLTGTGEVLCGLVGGAQAYEATLDEFVPRLEGQILKYLQESGTLTSSAPPTCHPSDRFCLNKVSRSDLLYRTMFFNIYYIHFWSLTSYPLARTCSGILKRRFTPPGLWSGSALQSSTFWDHRELRLGFMLKCAQFNHLLAYAPAMPGGCTDAYQSFFAAIYQSGALALVFPVHLPDGAVYRGSLTGLAISRDDGTLWACGRDDTSSPWYLYSFRLNEMAFGWDGVDQMEGYQHPEIPLRMCHRKELPSELRVAQGKEKCTLSWDKRSRWLWVGNLAQEDADGQAWGYDLQDVGEGCMTTRYHRRHMSYGKHVSAFTFLTDILGDDYVGLSRCDNYNRNNAPCAMEFFDVSSGRSDTDIVGKSPGTKIRTPAGIGSLMHDTNLGVSPYEGGYFHMSFIGMTSENVGQTADFGADPEDRVFVVRTPFLSTGIRKRVDNIRLSIFGIAIIPGGTPLVPIIPLRPDEDFISTANRRLSSGEDALTIHSTGAVSSAASGSHPRKLRESVPEGCIDLSAYLVNFNDGVGVDLSLNIGVGRISGGFWIRPKLVIGMVGAWCMRDMSLTLGLDIQFGVQASFSLSASMYVFKGGVSMRGTVLDLQFLPIATLSLKSGSVQPKLLVAIKLISIRLSAWYEVRACIKICCAKAGFAKICFPCGLKWCGRKSFGIGTINVAGDGRRRDVLNMRSWKPDRTPPTVGTVTLSQMNADLALVKFAQFVDRDSEIATTELTVWAAGKGTGGSQMVATKRFAGEAESWTGQLRALLEYLDTYGRPHWGRFPVPHESTVKACVKVTNVFNLGTTVCSAPLVWDAKAPKMVMLFTKNPFTGSWRIPEEKLNGKVITYNPMWTNLSKSMRFGLRIMGSPENEPARSVSWAVSADARCGSAACPEGTLLTSFAPVGYPERLAAGQYFAPIIDVRADKLKLIPGRYHYVNVRACDFRGNCAVSSLDWPIGVDDTAPVAPIGMLADRMRSTSTDGDHTQFWISRTRIDPIFVFDKGGFTRDESGKANVGADVTDPESGFVQGVVNLYQLRRGHPDGRRMVAAYQMPAGRLGDVPVPKSTPPYLHASKVLHKLALENGAQYLLQLTLINRAGGRTKWLSGPITVDYTPPVCSAPTIVAKEGQPVIAPFTSLPGSSPYFGTRAATWVSATVTAVSVNVGFDTCSDAESGIDRAQMWVGTETGIDDLIPSRVVALGTVYQLPILPNTNFQDRTYCTQCGEDIVIGVRCTNKATVHALCRPDVIVRVDGSPPACVGVQPLLGKGPHFGVQSSRASLQLGKLLDAGFQDKETGIKRSTYWLHDLHAVDGGALTEPLELSWMEHEGVPDTQKTQIQGLSLQHGHTYAVNISLTNYIGLQGWCISTEVTVDTTPPAAGVVLLLQHDKDNDDAMPVVNAFQYSTQVLRIANRLFGDTETGIDGFMASVYRTDGWLIQSETWVGPDNFVTLGVQLLDKQSFYVVMAAYNGAELRSEVATSNVVTVDATPPIIDFVRDSFGSGVRTLMGIVDSDVVAAINCEIGSLFSVSDAESGIREMFWCLGSFPGACDVVPPRPAEPSLRETHQSVGNLADGVKYYPLITIYNNAGDWQSAWTDGFSVDVSGPSCGVIHDGPGFDRRFVGPTVLGVSVVSNGNSTLAVGSMVLTWDGFTDINSGIAGYAAALVTADKVASVVANGATNIHFTDVGLAGSMDFFMILHHAETCAG